MRSASSPLKWNLHCLWLQREKRKRRLRGATTERLSMQGVLRVRVRVLSCVCVCACVCMRGPESDALPCSSLSEISLVHTAGCPRMQHTPSHATAARRARSRASVHVISVRAADRDARDPIRPPPAHMHTHTRCVPLCTVNAPPRMPVHDARPWFPRSPISPAPLPHWSHCVREVGTKTAIWHAAATLHPNSCLRPAPIAGRGGRVYKAMPPQPRAHLRFAFPSRRHVHRERGSR